MNILKNMNDVLNFLEGHINYEQQDKMPYKSKFKYKFILDCLNILDRPDDKFKIIHIAGTNGKGSVAMILSHLISNKGINVGAFLSPHVISVTERILIQNKSIDNDLFIEAANVFIKISKKLKYKASLFEVLTLIALISFDISKCQYVILETGLGGSLDSTNFASKKLVIINTIDYDHMHVLGNTLTCIAKEKAGIIKSNNNVLVGKQKRIIYDLLKEKAISQNAKIYTYSEDFFISNLICTIKGTSFKLHSYSHKTIKLNLPMLSVHQVLNLALSIEALSLLNINLSQKQINHSLKSLSLIGRFHYIKHICHIILDVAHNKHSMKALLMNLNIRFKTAPHKVLIIGINSSKDYEPMLDLLKDFFDYVAVCPLPFTIKKDISKDIFKYLSDKNTHYKTSLKSNFRAAYTSIKPLLKHNSLLVVTGSFYLVGEALSLIKKDQVL